VTNRYFDLIDQTFYFPQDGFDIRGEYLTFHGLSLKHLIEKYGTPLKLFYLPKIGMQIKRARNLFNRAIKQLGYDGKYYYCYCTKSSHFKFVLDTVLDHQVNLEISSAYDIDLIQTLLKDRQESRRIKVICNGFKPKAYLHKIKDLIDQGNTEVWPMLDNMPEFDQYRSIFTAGTPIGIRVATEEEPNFSFYTSRLGIPNSSVVNFYLEKIKPHEEQFPVKMLHFFVDTGIKDSICYWGELKKAIKLYCTLKKVCPSLEAINIGGGMPIRNSLGSEFDYKYMIKEIVRLIQESCDEAEIPAPDVYSEFGKYTVGESGAVIFEVLGQKQQNDSELWYMIDNSLMNTIPDSWGIGERFILLPVNKWYNEYTRVNIGGLSCDNSDYYNSELHENQVYLPKYDSMSEEPLYVGFFHTGAYQDALSGMGGLKHCLIPAPKIVVVDRDEKGNLADRLVWSEQAPKDMLEILGY